MTSELKAIPAAQTIQPTIYTAIAIRRSVAGDSKWLLMASFICGGDHDVLRMRLPSGAGSMRGKMNHCPSRVGRDALRRPTRHAREAGCSWFACLCAPAGRLSERELRQ